jgi:DNA-binding NtrC family response regulator
MNKILIVDDEQTIRDSAKMILEEEGYECDISANGKEALEKIKEEDYDILISDIKMPMLDGIQLMEETAKISPNTFVIIMTAYASVETAIAALRQGAYDYIIKPVEFDDLIIRVKRLLDYKKLSSENKTLRRRISTEGSYQNLIGKSDSMNKNI